MNRPDKFNTITDNKSRSIKCNKCGYFNMLGSRFCENCGTPLSNEAPKPQAQKPKVPEPDNSDTKFRLVTCPKCSTQNLSDSKTCVVCGTPLSEAEAIPVIPGIITQKPAPEPQEPLTVYADDDYYPRQNTPQKPDYPKSPAPAAEPQPEIVQPPIPESIPEPEPVKVEAPVPAPVPEPEPVKVEEPTPEPITEPEEEKEPTIVVKPKAKVIEIEKPKSMLPAVSVYDSKSEYSKGVPDWSPEPPDSL